MHAISKITLWLGSALSLLPLLAFMQPAWAADLALVVGIDEYRDDGPPKTPSPDLFSCARDAQAISTLLGEMGTPAKNIRLLTDDQATKQAMLDGLSWLAGACDAGSTVYFYYSGHGSEGLTDSGGDEPDGYDEGLVPTDVINPNDYFEQYIDDPRIKARVDGSQLYDDELNAKLAAIAGRAKSVVVILDTCHAAGATKGLGGGSLGKKEYFSALGIDPTAKPWGRPPQGPGGASPGGPGRPRPPIPGGPGGPGVAPPGGPVPHAAGGNQPPEPSALGSSGIGDDVFFEGQSSLKNLCVLAACEPTQFSQADPEVGHGSFTYALLQAIYNQAAQADVNGDGKLSWFEAGSFAHSYVSQQSQTKARESGDESMLQYPVLYNPALADGILIDAPTVGQGRELIEKVQLPEELLGE